MGKLKFKGDKPKIKKKRGMEEGAAPAKTSKKKFDIHADAISGWTSCAGLGDLNGPFVVVTREQDKPVCLELDRETEEWKRGDELEVNKETTNFLSSSGSDELVPVDGPYPDIHCIEPMNVCQTLVFVPISQASGPSASKKAPNQFAFKCFNGRYLTVDPRTFGIGTGFTITQHSTFRLESTEDSKDGLFLWKVAVDLNDKSYYLRYSAGSFQFADPKGDSDSDIKFAIRIQSDNSAAFKLARHRIQEDEASDIKTVIAGLKRDTKDKIVISGELIKRLQTAKKEGNLNEQIIEEKSRVLSRW